MMVFKGAFIPEGGLTFKGSTRTSTYNSSDTRNRITNSTNTANIITKIVP